MSEKHSYTPVSATTDEVIAAIRRNTAVSLPDDPSAAGMSAATIRKRLWAAICGTDASVLAELLRIIQEVNAAFGDVQDELKDIRQIQATAPTSAARSLTSDEEPMVDVSVKEDTGSPVLHFDFAIPSGKQGERGASGVYVGSGEMPEDCDVQIDPEAEDFEYYEMAHEAGESREKAMSQWGATRLFESAKCDGYDALKGSATGSAVRIDDASPIEHEMAVRVHGKNLLDDNPDNVAAVSFTSSSGAPKNFYGFALHLTAGTYTSHAEGTTGTDYIYGALVGADGVIKQNVNPVVAEKLNAVTFTAADGDVLYIYNAGTGNTIESQSKVFIGKYKYQVEQGTTATEYTPYVEPSGVKVLRYGKNLLNADGCLGKALTKDGDIFTLSNSSGERFSAKGAIYIPANTPITIGVDILEYTGTHYFAFNFRFVDESGAIEYHYLTVADHKKEITLGIAATSVSFYLQDSNDAVQLKFKNPQIELSDTATAYEPYTEPTEYTVNADGSVNGVQPLQPTTTLLTDTEGAVIDVEYNRDTTKAFDELKQAIISLGGNV